MTAPILTLRSNISPFSALTSLVFKQTAPSGYILPTLAGESSNTLGFRIYNNYALQSNVATALNVELTTFDGSGPASHTSVKSVVGEQWIRLYQNGFGESVGTPGVFSYWQSDEFAVGGSTNVFLVDKGSNGVQAQQIRAGSNNAGCGFIEIKGYAQVPSSAIAGNYTFSLSAIYEYIP